MNQRQKEHDRDHSAPEQHAEIESSLDVRASRKWPAIVATTSLLSAAIGGIWIIVWSGAAIVDVALRLGFVATSVLNLFILIAIVAQACIYWSQRNTMSRQLNEMRRQLDAMNAQSRIMSESLALTRKLTEQNEIFGRVSTRAYVFLDTATIEAPINSGKYPLARIVFKNSGKSPAFAHRVRIEQAFLTGDTLEKAKKGVMPTMRPLNKRGLGIIGADHFVTLHLDRDSWKSEEDERLAMEGKSIFFLWGVAVYSDIYGVEHSTTFSLYARNEKVTNLSFGSFGNDFEDGQAENDEAKPN